MPQPTRDSHLSILLGAWGPGGRSERRGGERHGWGPFTHGSAFTGVQQPPTMELALARGTARDQMEASTTASPRPPQPDTTSSATLPPDYMWKQPASLVHGFMWFSLWGLAVALAATQGSMAFPQLFFGEEETRRGALGKSSVAYGSPSACSSWGLRGSVSANMARKKVSWSAESQRLPACGFAAFA